MASEPVILELSSDEDDEPRFGKILRMGGIEKDGNLRDDSDDDCLVLDSDPEQSKTVVSDKVGGDEDEDLLVVQEKGQVALRDYPHSRHLCGTFLFNVSPHEQHCSLCHCYVCDCPAPCKFWGKGDLATDHCHSTDKDEKWKLMRLRFKRKIVSSHPDKHLGATSNVLPARNQIPFHCSSQVPLRNTAAPIRPCSVTSIRNRKAYNQSSPQLSSLDARLSQKHAECFARSNPSVNGTIPSQRVADFSGALSPQLMHPCSKRIRTTQPGLNIALSASNSFPRPLHNKDYVTANKFPSSPYLQQQVHFLPVSAKARTGMNNQEFEPLPATPSYLCQPGRPSVNSKKRCPAVVADTMHGSRVASNAVVPNVISPTGLSFGLPPGNVNQYLRTASLNYINPLGSSHRANNIPEHGHGEESDRSTVQPYNTLPPLSNSSYDPSHLQSILANVERMLGEPVSDVLLAGSDPNVLRHDIIDPNVLFGDDEPWSSILQAQNNTNPA